MRTEYFRAPLSQDAESTVEEGMKEPIAIQANLQKVTTLVDGGWRLSFDCSDTEGKQLILLNELKEENLYVVVLTEEQFQRQRKS